MTSKAVMTTTTFKKEVHLMRISQKAPKPKMYFCVHLYLKCERC